MTALRRAALIAVACAVPLPAVANDCARSYERAQEQRLDGKLRAARDNLLGCAQVSCPVFIRNDCTKWLDEVQAAQPTVVFVARQDGRDVEDVKVTCNDEVLTVRLDGRAMPLDPGKQLCRFEAAGFSATLELLVVEAQKGRIVELELRPTPTVRVASRPTAAAPRSAGPEHWWSPHPRLALAGVGVLGVAGFALLGSSGLRAENRLRDSCAPDCPPSDVSSVRLRYVLADVSLGVGLISGAVATYLFWRGGAERPPTAAVAVDRHGATLVVGSNF